MKNNKLFQMILASLFAAIIGILAQISVPIGTVPLTLQSVAVFLTAIILGKKWGTISVSLYVLMGAIGLPVYAGGNSGFAALFGPTGGYIISFILTAFICAFIHELGRGKLAFIVLGNFVGSLLLLTLGTLWLKVALNLSFEAAFLAGFAPFIISNILQIVLASLVSFGVLKRLPVKFLARLEA
ncbi:MAG: biotin transporter BioY [Streptococcaceae bacterium]|jgi:biotin transport system substrate-specific component|nr:biotin transporter BioY [Streptococcaceae bacterium]